MAAIAGGILLGLFAGCVLQFVPFMFVVLLAAAADLAISLLRANSSGMTVLSIVGLLCFSQIGYALGMIVQALVLSWLRARRVSSWWRKTAAPGTDIPAKD